MEEIEKEYVVSEKTLRDLMFRSYLAGIMDGEGSFCIKKNGKTFRGQAGLMMTDKEIIELIAKKFNKHVTVWKSKNKKRKIVYSIYWNSEDLINFIDYVLPFLIVKKEVAEFVRDFEIWKHKRESGRRWTEDELKYGNEAYLKSKKLNGVVSR